MSKSADLQEIIGQFRGNDKNFERLIQRVQSGTTIAFVGAGASAPLYPLWQKLIRELVVRASEEDLANEDACTYWLEQAKDDPPTIVSQIRDALGPSNYQQLLHGIFLPRYGDDGLLYTPCQYELMRANFRALITTNFDGGLIEARRAVNREGTGSGYTVWSNEFGVGNWLDLPQTADSNVCPILYAHGCYEDPSQIVLDKQSYRHAYEKSKYRTLFDSLWYHHNLVFVGFSFKDRLLTHLADAILESSARGTRMAFRHTAIMGIRDDHRYSPELRKYFHAAFHADAVFYPVHIENDGNEDHSALLAILKALPSVASNKAIDPNPIAFSGLPSLHSRAPNTPSTLFGHILPVPTQFVGRDDALSRLRQWADEPGVRVIAISGMGGIGKTSIATQWISHQSLKPDRGFQGIFCWSFDQDPDPRHFMATFVAGISEIVDYTPDLSAPLEVQARSVLLDHRFAIVLDGVETLQDSGESAPYGRLTDFHLRDFLRLLCTQEGKDVSSLVILTSRMRVTDLSTYSGGTFRPLALPSLAPDEGAMLLELLDSRDSLNQRVAISDALNNHPLTLRLYATAKMSACQIVAEGRPGHVSTLSGAQQSIEVNHQQDRIIAYYESTLPEGHRRLLELVSIFRAPVSIGTLSLLWNNLVEFGPTLLHDAIQFFSSESLFSLHLDMDGGVTYSCHSLVKDHFRRRFLLSRDSDRHISDWVNLEPSVGDAGDSGKLAFIGTLIELLAASGQADAADELYRVRLESGRVIRNSCAIRLGVEISSALLAPDTSRRDEGNVTEAARRAYYLSELGDFSGLIGSFDAAFEAFRESARLCSVLGDPLLSSVTVRNHAYLEVVLGHLLDARLLYQQALSESQLSGDSLHIFRSMVGLASVAALKGDQASANVLFEDAVCLVSASSDAFLFDANIQLWAEHLLRSGFVEDAARLIEKVHTDNSFDGARIEVLRGGVSVARGELDSARLCIAAALDVFCESGSPYESGRALYWMAVLQDASLEEAEALGTCDRILEMEVCTRCALLHADTLNLRSQLRLASSLPDLNRARDDADAAFDHAADAGYVRGQLKALELRCRIAAQMADSNEAKRCGALRQVLAERLNSHAVAIQGVEPRRVELLSYSANGMPISAASVGNQERSLHDGTLPAPSSFEVVSWKERTRHCGTLMLLVGASPVPNYLAAVELGARRAILYYSGDSFLAKERLKRVLELGGITVDVGDERYVEDPSSAACVRQVLAEIPAGAHLNYTGGTKIMAAQARMAFAARGGRPEDASYTDERRGTLRFDDGYEQVINTPITLEVLMALSGATALRAESRAGELLSGSQEAARQLLMGSGGLLDDGGWLERWLADIAATISGQLAHVGVVLEPDAGRLARGFEVDVMIIGRNRPYVLSCTTSASFVTCKAKLFEVAVRAGQIGGRFARAALVCLVKGANASGEPMINMLRQDVANVGHTHGSVRVFGREDLEEWAGVYGPPQYAALEEWLRS